MSLEIETFYFDEVGELMNQVRNALESLDTFAKFEEETGTPPEIMVYIFSNDTRYEKAVELLVRTNIVVCEPDEVYHYRNQSECVIPYQQEGFLKVKFDRDGQPKLRDIGFRQRGN